MLGAEPADRRVGPVGAIVCEGQPDRPDQRKNVDGEEQDDRGRDEEPGGWSVGETADPAGDRGGRASATRRTKAYSLPVVHRSATLIANAPFGQAVASEAVSADSRAVVPAQESRRRAGSTRLQYLPSSLRTLVQSTTSRSRAPLPCLIRDH